MTQSAQEKALERVIQNVKESNQSFDLEAGEEAYAALENEMRTTNIAAQKFNTREYLRAIEQVILGRNRLMSHRTRSPRALSRHRATANALFVVSNFFHDTFFTYSGNALVHRNPAVSLLSQLLPKPELKDQVFSQSTKPNAPKLQFVKLHYLDAMKRETGMYTWAVEITEPARKGRKPEIIPLPVPDNAVWGEVSDLVDNEIALAPHYLAHSDVEKYCTPLFDAE